MCSRGCQLQARRNYKDYLAQNQETNFEYWKIPVLSGAIPALINVDKSGPNHLKSLMFFEGALSPYDGVVSAAWRLLFGDNRMPTPTWMPADVCHWGTASRALA
jgi:hypothetical protein